MLWSTLYTNREALGALILGVPGSVSLKRGKASCYNSWELVYVVSGHVLVMNSGSPSSSYSKSPASGTMETVTSWWNPQISLEAFFVYLWEMLDD